MAASPIRVAIVDDHPMVRTGLRSFLEVSSEIVIVGEAESGQAAVEMALCTAMDVLLMDLVMPGHPDGVEATRIITSKVPDVKVIALTSFVEPEHMLAAIAAGAVGYLHKDVMPDDLLRAIEQVAAGRSILEPQALRALRQQRDFRATQSEPATVSPSQPSLTSREQEVLAALACGYPNKEIAARLGITEKTVKAHISHILAKLDVYDRTQAVIVAARLGLVKI